MSRSIRMELLSLAKEAWLRPLRKRCEASLAGAARSVSPIGRNTKNGVVRSATDYRKLNEPLRPRLLKERGRLFDGAATPPLPRRGVLLDPKCCQENKKRRICYPRGTRNPQYSCASCASCIPFPRFSPRPLLSHRCTIDFLTAQVNLIDLSRVGDVFERIGIQHNEVGALARGYGSELVELQGFSRETRRRNDH